MVSRSTRATLLARQAALEANRPKPEPERFVFVQPQVDLKALKTA